MVLLSHHRTIKILTEGTKAKIFKWHILVQVEGFRLRPR